MNALYIVCQFVWLLFLGYNSCCKDYNDVFDMLERNHNLVVSLDVHDDTESLEGPQMRIQGQLVSYLERLDDELNRSLQIIDPHTTEYVTRLRDEMQLIMLAYRCREYAERVRDLDELCRSNMRLVDHMYYKVIYILYKYRTLLLRTIHCTNLCIFFCFFNLFFFCYYGAIILLQHENVLRIMVKAVGDNLGREVAGAADPSSFLVEMCKFLYTHDSTARLRTRAMLCHIYHFALHDKWFEARNLMLMSHLQVCCDSGTFSKTVSLCV